jgi:hypothetical protein
VTNTYRVEFNMHRTRGDVVEAVVDLADFTKWYKGTANAARAITPGQVSRLANDMMEYLQAKEIPHKITPGEYTVENYADMEMYETFDGDKLEEAETLPADGIPEEFREKQRNLAVFLFNMNNGPVASVTEWLDQYGDTDYYSNYMADAAEILKLQPHLLSYGARAEMGIEP